MLIFFKILIHPDLGVKKFTSLVVHSFDKKALIKGGND